MICVLHVRGGKGTDGSTGIERPRAAGVCATMVSLTNSVSTALRSLACSLLVMLRRISSACSARLSAYSRIACAGVSAPISH